MLISRNEAGSGRPQTHYLPGGWLATRVTSNPIGWMHGASRSLDKQMQTPLQQFGRTGRYA